MELTSYQQNAAITHRDDRQLVSIETRLSSQHLDVFRQTVANILATDIAEETYAQIIDGLPLTQVAKDSGNGGLPLNHPIHEEDAELCSGVRDKLREFKSQFKVGALRLDCTVRLCIQDNWRLCTRHHPLLIPLKWISDYGSSAPGFRSFNMRLVELVAEAVHEVAVLLFRAGTSFYSNDRITSWTPRKDDIFWDFCPKGAWPTLFYHHWYSDHEQCPNGVADIVGLWVEARVFARVVLFDRRNSRTAEAQPDSIWFHSDRSEVTYRTYKLLDDQKLALLQFLTTNSPDLDLLPILGDEKNDCREDPEQPINETGIYRHIWDGKPLSEDTYDERLKDVWDQFECPTLEDFMRAKSRARELRQRRLQRSSIYVE